MKFFGDGISISGTLDYSSCKSELWAQINSTVFNRTLVLMIIIC